MRFLSSPWRYIFERSDLPHSGPPSLDDIRARGVALAAGVAILLFVVLDRLGKFLIATIDLSVAAVIVACFAIPVVAFLAIFSASQRLAPARFRAIRQQSEQKAVAAGFDFYGEFPPPSSMTTEAVFHDWRFALVPERLTEVITGVTRGYAFTAGHLEGHEFSQTRVQTRVPFSENIVMLKLPSALPELKLRDRSASSPRDYGLSFGSVPTGDAAVDRRWDVQSRFPELAPLFFTDEFRACLSNVPLVPCTIVIRNGYLIACRDPRGTFESITQRLDILVGLANVIPPSLWERETTALERGDSQVVEPTIKATTWPIFRR